MRISAALRAHQSPAIPQLFLPVALGGTLFTFFAFYALVALTFAPRQAALSQGLFRDEVLWLVLAGTIGLWSLARALDWTGEHTGGGMMLAVYGLIARGLSHFSLWILGAVRVGGGSPQGR